MADWWTDKRCGGGDQLREVVRLEPTHERAREALAHVEGAG
jgi:hypothetical protein